MCVCVFAADSKRHIAVDESLVNESLDKAKSDNIPYIILLLLYRIAESLYALLVFSSILGIL